MPLPHKGVPINAFKWYFPSNLLIYQVKPRCKCNAHKRNDSDSVYFKENLKVQFGSFYGQLTLSKERNISPAFSPSFQMAYTFILECLHLYIFKTIQFGSAIWNLISNLDIGAQTHISNIQLLIFSILLINEDNILKYTPSISGLLIHDFTSQ